MPRTQPLTARLRWPLLLVTCLATREIVAAPAKGVHSPPACVTASERFYNLRNYTMAARKATNCWAETQDPLMLYRAAQAWRNAGHPTFEIVVLERFLKHSPTKTGVEKERRTLAQLQLDDARTKVGSLTLSVSPPLQADESLHVLATLDSVHGAPYAQQFTAADAMTFALEPGVWTLDLARAGYPATKRMITIPADRTPQARRILMVNSSPPAVPLRLPTSTIELTPANAIRSTPAVTLVPRYQGTPEVTLAPNEAVFRVFMPVGRWSATTSTSTNPSTRTTFDVPPAGASVKLPAW